MKIKQLIEKLKTFPPEDSARFYCPRNQEYYYYLYEISYPNRGGGILAISKEKCYGKIFYRTLIKDLKLFPQNHEAIFLDVDTKVRFTPC